MSVKVQHKHILPKQKKKDRVCLVDDYKYLCKQNLNRTLHRDLTRDVCNKCGVPCVCL